MPVDPDPQEPDEPAAPAAPGLRPVPDRRMSDQVAWDLVDAAPDAIVVTDDAGRILLVNTQGERLFGYGRDALLGREVEVLLPERFRAVHRSHRARYQAQPRTRAMGVGLRLFGQAAGGAEFPVEISLSPMAGDGGPLVIAFVRDVTDRVQAEVRTREITEVLNTTHDAVSIVDAVTFRFTYVNEGLIEQTGYSQQELLQRTMLDIVPDLDESSLLELLAPLQAGSQRQTTLTTHHRHRSGSEVPVEIVLQAIFDDNGTPQAYVKIARDITGRLEAEKLLREAEADLQLSADRERIGRDLHDLVIQRLFAAGMTLEALSSRVARPEERGRLGEVIDELDATIREIRTVIFRLEHEHGPTSSVRGEVLQILTQAQPALGFEPRLRFDGVIESLPPQVADHLLATLREALSNIARHARATDAEVTIAVDDRVVLRVEDNGCGIPDRAPLGNGLRNAAARAAELGGTFHAVPAKRGTVVEWSAPLTADGGRAAP